MSRLLATVLTVMAAPPADVDPDTGKGPEWGKAAPIGLLIILLMGIALFFLLRSMTRRLKKVPASFDPPPERRAEPAATDSPVVVTAPDGDPAAPGPNPQRSG